MLIEFSTLIGWRWFRLLKDFKVIISQCPQAIIIPKNNPAVFPSRKWKQHGMKCATGHRSNDIRIQKCRESINYLQKSTQTFFFCCFSYPVQSPPKENVSKKKNLFLCVSFSFSLMYERSFLVFSFFRSC